jgi:autotransporter-associated beta strand protein
LTINGTAYPYSGGLSVWINANNSVGNQVNNWMEWGIDGSGNDNRTLFQFVLPQTSSANFLLTDVQFGVHDDWGNYQPWHLHTTLPFNSSATWSNPGSGAPAGGSLLVDCGDNSSGNAGGSELIWDSQAGVGASQSWVYPLTNLVGVAAAALTSTNPVDLIFDTDWGNWDNDGGSAPYFQLNLTLAHGPLIVNQPGVAPSNTVYAGNSIALSVVAATDYSPVFHWYKDGTMINPSTNLNATVTSTNTYDSELVLANTATTDSGHYYVIVTDANGSTTSLSNNVTILSPLALLTNGVQKFGSLANTSVTMSNRCELWVTNSATPLSGCTISLNSVDAWLFLQNVKPSVTISNYLGQVRVNGAAAVAGGNCRVVQYGQNGAVVIPQASSFQPLTVFTGAEFTGTATSYGQWTYYTGSTYSNISSFKLKRGYMAVLAQSTNGANYSQCYVAQDGDLEIGVLPATLSQQVQFIYVTPWRWTSKKGIAGNPPYSELNVNWWYDWNIDQNSSSDLEYAAIRQERWWPGLGLNWQTMGVNTVLGYNEPDSSSQADIAVGDAVWSWPDLLATGQRVGSPACTDGGVSSWLLPFMTDISTAYANEDNAAGLRVDFVAQHYYQAADPSNPSACASQMYNFLLNIWNNTHKPIWITEWNNGANWTDNDPYPVPTYAQQQADIAAMTQMLESTPFVERYALYNWVEDGRSLVNSSGAVTLAGTTYSNLVSALSYLQAMPDNGTRGIAEFLFATNLWDTSGYFNNGMVMGAPSYSTGHIGQAQSIVLDGANSYVQLPANIAKGSGFTFAAWVYWNGGGNWQRIFDFGSVSTTQGGTPSQYMYLTPSSGSALHFAINNGSGEQTLSGSGVLASGSWQHVAVTLNGSTAILYLNGAQVASASVTITPSAFSPTQNYLGKSQFSADPLFNGKLDEVEIADYAMTPAQIAVFYNGTQNPNFISGLWTNNISGNWSTSNNWKGGAVANGVSRIADFSTINITANQTVTLDSARTVGGLRFGDTIGSQNWLLAGANPLTLDAGGGNTPVIGVNQNTATISTPIIGSYGFTKTGGGALTLNGTNNIGGGLTVDAGTVNFLGGTTSFGSGTSTIGYLTGTGNLTMTGGSLALAGELRVGGSDQSGRQYVATGAVTASNATLSVGSLTVARGNYLDNDISGTLTLSAGSTLISTNDATIEFAGQGLGKLVLNGGNFILGPTAPAWLMVGYWDSGAGELDISSGNLLLENSASIKMSRSYNNTGSNVVNQLGGAVTFYSDAGLTVGGGGNLDLDYGGTASTNTYNLNGGTLTVPQITASVSTGRSLLNFNGGTLKPTANNASFVQGLTLASIRNNGAKMDTAGFNVTIGQALQHSAISGDNATDGGLTKNGAGILTLNGSNTYTGATTINAGAVAFGSAGSFASSRSITIAGGALFDVSAVGGGYTLGASKTLSGSGTVNGTITNQGTISPGAAGAFGTLTFSNSPVLNGALLMKVNRNNGAPLKDQISLPASGMTYGGTLTVTNLGAGLTAGDSFAIFSAPSYNGAFAQLNLPALDAGLAWNTNTLTNGVLSVVTTVGPQFTSLAQSSDGNFQFSGSGAAGVTYTLNAATNLTPPEVWTFVTNAVANQAGLFQFSDLSATNFPERFYRISSSY